MAVHARVLIESNGMAVFPHNDAITITHYWSSFDGLIQDGIPAHRLLSVLNLSHASFNVLNTAALIIRCSVLASCGI